LLNKKNNIVDQLVSGIEGVLVGNGVELVQGTAKFIDENNISVNENVINAKNIIIATGSNPKRLQIDIDSNVNVMDSTDILNLNHIPKSCAIIGGGVIGVELGYFLKKAGSDVTIVEFMDSILPMLDEEIQQLTTEYLISEGIKIETSSQAMEIKENKLIYKRNNAKKELYFDEILVSVGRSAVYESLEIENVGIKTERNFIKTNSFLQTNIKNIYAVGDVNGKSMLAHTASMEAIVAVEHICGLNSEMDYTKIPNAIYTNTEIATVGLTEKEAKEKYKNIKVGRFPFMANGKSKIEGCDNGLIKVIIDDDIGEILGVHIFGVHSTDMIAEAVVAMNLEATPEEMVRCIHPHPTVSEVFQEVFHDLKEGSIHYL
jgi:dihydrolipoamide dehydrogenase